MEELKEKINSCCGSSFNGLVGVVTILLICLIFSVVLDVKDKWQDTESMITVSATGEVYVQPDLAKTSFSVVTEAKTVSEALNLNSEKMNAVIAFVKGEGVEEKDLKTTNFNIYPRYEWRDETSSYYPTGERILVGYEVSQSLEVKMRDLTKVGSIIEGAVTAGANQVGSLAFTVDDEDEFRAEARGKAIEEAKEKAETLASQLGVNLGKVSAFSESGGRSQAVYYEAKAESDEGMGGVTPSIETGENKIEVSVSITYKIK